MGYWSGIYRVLKQLTPMLLKAAATASDVKKLLRTDSEKSSGTEHSESVTKVLKKQSEWNEQINEQVRILKTLLEKNQKYIFILSIAVSGILMALIVLFIILLVSI